MTTSWLVTVGLDHSTLRPSIRNLKIKPVLHITQHNAKTIVRITHLKLNTQLNNKNAEKFWSIVTINVVQ